MIVSECVLIQLILNKNSSLVNTVAILAFCDISVKDILLAIKVYRSVIVHIILKMY